MSRLEKAFRLFDAYNQKDPNIFIWNQETYPQEYFLALRLYEWVLQLQPDASEELLLASRSQHIGRWEMPRDSYPEGREAYLRWRRELAIFHAEKSTALMVEAGFGTETTSRVRQIILKQKIKVDPEVQTIENALCLVFLQFQYEDFHHKHSPEKVINILKKSLLKMDQDGHQHALSLKYTAEGQNYINEALKLI